MAFTLARLFGTGTSGAAASAPSTPAGSAVANRRQMSRMALQTTLRQHGIPETWVGLETLVRVGRSQDARLDIRLVIRHWDEALVVHCMALQKDFERRLHALDPLSKDWMTGVAWEFALPDDAQYPGLPAARVQRSTAAMAVARQPAPSRELPAAACAAASDREVLLKMFEEPAGQAPAQDRAYACTVPAALH